MRASAATSTLLAALACFAPVGCGGDDQATNTASTTAVPSSTSPSPEPKTGEQPPRKSDRHTLPAGTAAAVDGVADGVVTTSDVDRALGQLAATEGLTEPPAPAEPGYNRLVEAAISDLLLSAWLDGELAERGIEISESEIDEREGQIIAANFGADPQAYEQFQRESGLNAADARRRVRFTLAQERVVETGVDIDELVRKWTARTTCARGYIIERCSNFKDH